MTTIDILREDPFTFMIISFRILRRMRKVSNKRCREINTHTFYVQYFLLFHNNNGYDNALQCYVIVHCCLLISSVVYVSK
jgi:hypothetical protein